MTDTIQVIIQEIGKDLVEHSHVLMAGPLGINKKVGINTLKGSDVDKETSYGVTYNPEPLIDILYNFYMQFIEDGRPPEHGKWPPINVIVKWMEKKHISPRNGTVKQVAFLIARAIWRDGYDGRPVIQSLMDWAEMRWEGKWSQALFSAIIDDIDKFFND